MTDNVFSIGSKKKPVRPGTTISVRLGKAMLAVQYYALVKEDHDVSRDILRAVLVSPIFGEYVMVPHKLVPLIAETDTAAAYKALMSTGK